MCKIWHENLNTLWAPFNLPKEPIQGIYDPKNNLDTNWWNFFGNVFGVHINLKHNNIITSHTLDSDYPNRSAPSGAISQQKLFGNAGVLSKLLHYSKQTSCSSRGGLVSVQTASFPAPVRQRSHCRNPVQMGTAIRPVKCYMVFSKFVLSCCFWLLKNPIQFNLSSQK